jgi:hypothetical protein
MRLGALRWRIIARAHPVKSSLLGGAILLIVAVCLTRRVFLTTIPLGGMRTAHSLFEATQKYPTLGRFIHVLFNAVPDTAFALLAIAGLSYLAPGWVKKLETMRAGRAFLIAFFVIFAAVAILVNAVNREGQEHTESVQQERMAVVMKDITNIQDALKKPTNLTEAERREHLIASLRDEYIISQRSLDPDILAGSKMPPPIWLNDRLRAMGETWRVAPNLTVQSSTTPKNPENPLIIKSVIAAQELRVGNPLEVRINLQNVSGKTLKVRESGAVLMFQYGPDDPAQVESQEGLWAAFFAKAPQTEEEIPIGQDGLFNKLLQSPPISEGEAQKMVSKSTVPYFFFRIQDVKSGEDLVEICGFLPAPGMFRRCSKHNKP